jgi:phosphatidylglycerophosphate synthase
MKHESIAKRRPIPARNSWVSIAIVKWLSEAGITPNQISVFGLLVGVGSGLALFLTQALPGLARPLWIACAAMVVMRGLSNMFDGMVAVEHGRASPVGLLYNEIPDRLSDVALMVGAGYSLGGSATAGWAAAWIALFVTYVRAVGSLAGAPADFGGPMAKQQRMFSIAGVAFLLGVTPMGWHPALGSDHASGLMAITLWIIVAGGLVTAVKRLRRAARALLATKS